MTQFRLRLTLCIFPLSLLLSASELFGEFEIPQSFAWKEWISGSSSWEDPKNLSNLSPEAKDLINKSLKDLPAVIDTHLHLICKDPNHGCYVPHKLFAFTKNPWMAFKTKIMMSALGVKSSDKVDEAIVERMNSLINNFPTKPYIAMAFAFSASYDKQSHKKDLEKTGLEVSNYYMQDVVDTNPTHLIPVYSLHPFEADLEKLMGRLSRPLFFKTLPNSMNYSPSDDECEKFFSLIAKNNSVLITHVGDERSVEGGGITNRYGNPIFYEKWLRKFRKLRIIFAHAGGSGSNLVQFGKREDNFDIVLDILKKYPNQTYADISGFSLAPNLVTHLPKLIQAKEVHDRIFYGSDYPLVSVKPLMITTLGLMYFKDLLGDFANFKNFFQLVLEIYKYNPLLASFVIMRNISYQGQSLPNSIFYLNARRLIEEDFDINLLNSGKAL